MKAKVVSREVARPSNRLVVWLEDVRNSDIPIVGGKGASLGEMINAELPVPRGFVVTAQAFREFIETTGIMDRRVDLNQPVTGPDRRAARLV